MNSLPEIPDIDAEFSESNPDAHLDAIRQEHEAFLTDLEAAAVKALASGDWDSLQSCIFFYNPQTKSYDS